MKNFLFSYVPLIYTAICVALALAASGAVVYSLHSDLELTRSEFASSTASYEARVHELTSQIAETDARNAALISRLQEEIARNEAYGHQVESLASTIATLDKLSKTDRELLQKYSDVYFLSEHYVPTSLTNIETEYAYKKDTTLSFHTEIKPKLTAMMNAASAQGAPMLVLSAFRSFGQQAGLKSSYKVIYGTGANAFSADQGYSEHQLGSTVDFTTQEGGENLSLFQKTKAFTWLEDNAHKYGFILSYPKDNRFFEYEPWHWRYVGVELATRLHDENKHFYDLDQREINTYLIKIFD